MNTEKWQLQIDETTALFMERFASLSAEQLNFKPDPGTWSIAQNIDHLIVINSSYYPLIASVRNGTYRLPWTGRSGFIVNMLGNAILKGVEPERRKKVRTFPMWEPSASELPAYILTDFANHQDDLKKLVTSCSDLLDKKTVISSPANRYIVYTLEKAFDIIVTHEKRHLAQAEELLDLVR